MTDKEVLFVLIEREIDNLIARFPALALFSGTIKSKVFQFIDPYVSYFMEGEVLRTDVATSFVQEELGSKIEQFKNKFDKEREKDEKTYK